MKKSICLWLIVLTLNSCTTTQPLTTEKLTGELQGGPSTSVSESPEAPSDTVLQDLDINNLTEEVVDPEKAVSGSSAIDRSRFENQAISKGWKFEHYVYKFTQKDKSYVIQYATKSGGPIYGVLFTRNAVSQHWNAYRYVYDQKNLNKFIEYLNKDTSIDVILLGFISEKGGKVAASITENTTIARVQPSANNSNRSSSSSATNTQIIDTVKTAAKSDFFKVIKLADPENTWSVLNDSVLKEVAKGSVKAVSIGNKLINYVDMYSDIYRGINEIESKSRYYNANDLTNMKLLLGLEIYMKYFDEGVFAGSSLDVGAFRKFYSWYTQTVHQSYNEYLGIEPKSFSLKIQKKGWFFGYPEAVNSARVTMLPVRIYEPNGAGSAWLEISLKDYDDRLYWGFSGVTNSKGEIKFAEQNRTKAGIWLVEVESGGKTYTKYLNIDPRQETIGFDQNMSKTVYLD